MHKKHAAAGLVVITLNTDEAKDKEARKDIRAFLNEKQASTINLLLDEPGEFMQKKLRYDLLPCYYVFDRQGKWTQFVGDVDNGKGVDYRAMDRLIEDSLKEK